ncbi:MAG TPA: MarR family transcriptional regulator [Gaiellaceae bacterium]|nr:MarR family transcriptional regulator [Gaiellaceae bacterium]
MIREATDIASTAERLRPVVLRLARELRRETEQLGVTSRQVTLLWLVREHPGLTLRELAALEGISAPSLSAHVDRLERAGLIARVRRGDDRRRVGLALTPAGSQLLRRVRTRRTTWLAKRLSGLEPGEVEAIERALAPLRKLLPQEDA